MFFFHFVKPFSSFHLIEFTVIDSSTFLAFFSQTKTLSKLHHHVMKSFSMLELIDSSPIFIPDMPNTLRKNRIEHELGHHNNPGQKETLMKVNENGDCISVPSTTDRPGSRKHPPINVTPPRDTKKKKMMPRVSREQGQQPDDGDMLFTESLGPNGEFLVLTGSRNGKGDPWLHPISLAIKDPRNNFGDMLVDPNIFDCRLHDPKHLYVKKSPDRNEKIPFRKKTLLFHMGVVACPNKDNFTKELKKDPFHLEKLFKSQCDIILEEYDKKKEKTSIARSLVGQRPTVAPI